MLNKLISLFVRFSGTIIQFISGILISRYSSADVTAYYFFLLSSVWITVYVISLGFPNHIFIVISESGNDGKHLNILRRYIFYFLKLMIPVVSFLVIILLFYGYSNDIRIDNYFLIFCTAFILSLNRFCSEALKGSNFLNLGLFFDRTSFPLFIMINIFYMNSTNSLSIDSISYSFIYSALFSLILSYFTSGRFLNYLSSEKFKIKLAKTHLGSQYIIELCEVLINRLPIIILNFIFNDVRLIAGLSICFTLVSISGTINFALYPFFGRDYIQKIKSQEQAQAIETIYKSQLWCLGLYALYFFVIFFFGELILSIYNKDFVSFNNYLVFYSFFMIFNQFFGVSDYLMSLIRKDFFAIIFKFLSLMTLILFSALAYIYQSVEIFLISIVLSVFIKNVLAYVFHLKYVFKN